MWLALIKVSQLYVLCLFISIWSYYVGQTEQHQNQTRPVSLFHSQHRHTDEITVTVNTVCCTTGCFFLSSIELVYVITIKNSIRKETKK